MHGQPHIRFEEKFCITECISNVNRAPYEIFKKWGNFLRNIRKGSLATDGDIQDTGVHVVNTVLPAAAEAKFMFGSR